MWQRLLPAYYQKHNGGGGRGGGGERPPSPSSSTPLKERQQQKQLMPLKFGRRPWRSRTNKSKPHHLSNTHTNNTSNNVHNHKKKETDTIARLLSLERHLEKDSDDLFCWTEYDDDDDLWKNDHDSPLPVTADDIEQALARFDTAIQQCTEATADTVALQVPSIVSPSNSFHGSKPRECSITVIGPNSLADHNPISALSIYTDGGITYVDGDGDNADVDNTDATINTMPSLFDNTVTTQNTMPSLVDHSISTSNSMPSLLDHTVTTTNTMPSLLDNTVTSVNTLPSMLDNSVTTLGYDEEEVEEIDMRGMNTSMDLDVDIEMDMDVTVSTSGDGDEDTIAKAVNAVLKDHHNRDFILPATRRRESSLLVARRDSCSTISTAPDTPESPLVISEYLVGTDSPNGGFKTTSATTTTKNPILTETCNCPLPRCPRCSKIVWPLEFFFVHTAPLFPSSLPRIRKSKKFVPDPMTVGDFYGDDDEDIRFVPQAFEPDTPSPPTSEQGDQEIVFGLGRIDESNNVDKGEDKADHNDKDNDATSTISTWTGEQENDEEDDMDSQIKSYSHRSGSSDIVSQMTADRTPKVKNKCNSNRRLFDHDMDEWKENLSSFQLDEHHETRSCNKVFVPYQERTLDPQHVLSAGNMRHSMMRVPSMQLKTVRTRTDSFLAKLVRPPYAHTPNPTAVPRPNRLWRCPSMGLEGILPPVRHNLSFIIPPPPPPPPSPPPRTREESGTFQVTRIEI